MPANEARTPHSETVQYGQLLIAIAGIGLGAGAMYSARLYLDPRLPVADPMQQGTTAAQAAVVAVAPQAAGGRGWVGEEAREAFSTLRSEIALLRGEVDALRQELRQEQATRASAESAAAGVWPEPAAEADGEVAVDPAAEEARLVEEGERQVQAHLQSIEDTLYAEPVDPDWSFEAEELIRGVLAGKAFKGTSLFHVECRATLCQIEVGHDDSGKREEFERHFQMEVASMLPRAAMRRIEDESGRPGTVIYLAREGHRFPQPTQ